MAPPPKKDAFADLFQSASGAGGNKQNNLSLLERQKQLQGKSNTSVYSSTPNSASSSWSNIDILTPSRTTSPNVAVSSTSKNHDDPFDIFNTTDNSKNNVPVTKAKPMSGNKSEMSLLDDEFTDFFPENTNKPNVDTAAESKPKPKPESPRPRAPRPREPVPRTATPQSDQKDFVIAELIDIGFGVDDANEAIAKVGLDLQKCVNYIMNKNSGKQNITGEDNVLGRRPEGIKFNELGTDLFKKANSFINFSKQTVLKNLEQLNLSQESSSNVPEWMKNQAKYKSEAAEKKYGGEDYGTDEENINSEEIEKFMRQQKERERERARTRFQNKNGSTTPELPSRPPRSKESTPPLPSRPARSKESIPQLPSRPPRSTEQTPSLPSRPKPKPKATSEPPAPPPAEIDLLGLGSSTHVSTTTSSLRDSSPLNQFILTDYTLAKEKASTAFKSGDYTTALETYSACLSLLPAQHELRVVVLSNLASINKLQGHLKESLDNITQAGTLLSPEELTSDQLIASKSIKYWNTKLVMIKAEVLELLEKYEQSLEQYLVLIQKLNCNDKKVMDGKRRVDKIVNPQNYKPVQKPAAATPTSRSSTPKPKTKPQQEEEVDTLMKDQIDGKIQKWADSKQNNLRAMLTNLNEIIPSNIKMNDKLRTLTLNDLMLPKQVKIQYMKVISSIHPDKLASQTKGDKQSELICNGVFIILNKRWEEFRQEENI
ncbi:Auxilin-like clathrin uncoating factor, putative, partial [Candida maltosa Xu316]